MKTDCNAKIESCTMLYKRRKREGGILMDYIMQNLLLSADKNSVSVSEI